MTNAVLEGGGGGGCDDVGDDDAGGEERVSHQLEPEHIEERT